MTRSVVSLALLIVTTGRLGAQVRREFTQVHLGVPVRIVLYAPDDSAARPAARAAFARIAALEDKMSDYRPASELRRLETRPGEWVPVSRNLFAVLARAIEIAGVSDGAFDPTAGPLVALWRETRRTGRLPDAAALDSARALVGWRHLELDSARRAVRLAVPGMRLDLGGIAKGYILDAARAVLAAHGITRVLVEAGGDLVVGDPPPGTAGWRIEVRAADSAFAARAGALANAAVATSGPTEQFVRIDGTRYSHVVDPRTGHALANGVLVTVIAPDGATADGLATALTVLDAEQQGALLARYPGVRASVREVGE
ncbi:MAG: FAD:protein FMN transferase [Gemmatimonadota bacterium]|nr:FAD:protein FMN transferase [Gemmatimonadota bacterium]